MGRPLKSAVLLTLLFALLCPGGALARERALQPLFSGTDKDRPRVSVKLRPVVVNGKPLVARFPTEIRFFPSASSGPGKVMVIAEKRGALRWVVLRTGETGYFFRVGAVGIEVEQGLMGFDFDPEFPKRPYIYTYHLAPGGGFGGRSVITRWTVWGDDVRSMTATSKVVLEFPQPQAGHNGGQVAFGPDGMLYVGFGDGGWQGDPRNRGQDGENLHGTVIRIDVRSLDGDVPYTIPPDNPFVDGGHQPEVFAYGFRNPFRFDFGPSGRLLLADVGQERLEEINDVVSGGNYGWSFKEGSLCYGLGRLREGSCDDPSFIDPIHEYRRSEGRAVIGGKFYRGRRVPKLAGFFLFGDYTNGRLWGIKPGDDGEHVLVSLGGFGIAPVCFGQDEAGEIYVGVQRGRIYKIVPGPPT
ncbi:MAG: PQQ-dependent sugar dehydrogenase [Deltaproteobacteria bacterium]|nr:PQQ-dependent sugar dehydrogenase [Deltaproteobacteria bacterium]